MMEGVFPLLGTVFVLVVALPLIALVAKAGLLLLEDERAGGPLHGLNVRYLLLTAPGFLPIAWLLSAAAHQSEDGRSTLACLLEHTTGALCPEPGLFAAVLTCAVLGCSARAWRRSSMARPSETPRTRALHARLDAIIARRGSLVSLAGRLEVSEATEHAIGTHGLVRPRVLVGVAFAEGLSDEALESALAHEAEHVRALDPLRYFVLELALAMNPVGRIFLEPHAARWFVAREAHCDREAVIEGAPPMALAEAIVRAARPCAPSAVALANHEVATLRLRVGLLCAFTERSPVRCCHRGPSAFSAALVLLVVVSILPHRSGTAALDALHSGAELGLTYFWR